MKITPELAKTPKISIIITFYNLGEYIEDCIKSILEQTYQNFEIIIVNDNSDEKNSLILKETIKNFSDERIKIIDLKENLGQLGAFLDGVKVAQGEFVTLTDADDILLPNHLKTLLWVHLNHPCAFVSSQRGEINEKGEVISLNKLTQNKIRYEEIEELMNSKEEFELEYVKAPFGLWSWNPSTSALIRKNALDILEFYPDIKYWRAGADKVIFSFLHLLGGSVNISIPCFLYRTHSQNSFNSSKNTGAQKYLREDCVEKLIGWNKKLRLDAILMFVKNKKQLIEKYNKINYYKMFFRVVFCINHKVIIKVLKTLIHKI